MPQETNLSNDEHIERMLFSALNSISNVRMIPMDKTKEMLLKMASKLIRAAVVLEE